MKDRPGSARGACFHSAKPAVRLGEGAAVSYRLIGLAWLEDRDPVILAALSSAVMYGHTLTPAELDTVLAGIRAIQP